MVLPAEISLIRVELIFFSIYLLFVVHVVDNSSFF